MAAINPVPRERAAAEVAELFDKLIQGNGFMPNFFGIMAHRPQALNAFVPLYATVINKGTVEPRYKELAYLKTSTINGCQY